MESQPSTSPAPFRQPLLVPALGAVSGCLVAHWSGLPAAIGIALAIVSLSLLVFRRGKIVRFLVAACLFGAGFSVKAAFLRELPLLGQLEPGSALAVLVRGVVVSEPTLASDPWGSARCEIALDTLAALDRGGDPVAPQPGGGRKVWATLRGTGSLSYGDRVEIRGALRLPAEPRNPGEFDFPAFLATRAILAEIATAQPSDVRVLASGAGNPLTAASHRARDRIREAITLDLAPRDPEVAGVISAMVLGEREDAPREMIDDFKLSGTLHLFAVSGLHVGMIALILIALLRVPRTPRRLAAILVIVALIAYAFVTGLRPSAVRATIMAAIVLTGILVDRPARILNSLGAAALFILALDPFQALAPGFQLSFTVLLAIALLTGPFQRLLAPLVSADPFLPRSLVSPRARRFHAAGGHLADNVAVSTAASLGSLPLMLLYFNLATPIAVVTNCLLVPLAFCLIFTAVASILLQLVALSGLGILLNNANFLLVKIIASIIAIAAAVPGGNFYVSGRPWFTRETCEIEILDIPKGGAAIALHTRSGERWLVDTGSATTYDSLLAPYARHAGLNRLDGLVLTHGDSLHLGAAENVLADYRPDATHLSLKDLRSPALRAAIDFLAASEREPHRLRRGDVLRIDAGTTLHVLFPPDGHEAARADDHCLVLRLDGEGGSVLLTGDSGFETERWLLANTPSGGLRADLLVIGRHRDDPGGLRDFLAAVGPRALITSHSASPSSERLPASLRTHCAELGILLIDQAESGAVRASVSAKGITLTPFLSPGKTTFLPLPADEARPAGRAPEP